MIATKETINDIVGFFTWGTGYEYEFITSITWHLGDKQWISYDFYCPSNNKVYTVFDTDIKVGEEIPMKERKLNVIDKVYLYENGEWFNCDEELAAFYCTLGSYDKANEIRENIKTNKD